MLKKHLAACLVASAFAAVPALAQTSTTSPSGATDRPAASGTGSPSTGSPAMQPNTTGTMPSTPSTGAAAPGSSPGTMSTAPSNTTTGSSATAQGGGPRQFLTRIETSHLLASKLIGTTVVGANNESIGDVNDVVVDQGGRAMAVVIGVGGFLGIGEKDVAVPFNALEFNAAPAAAANRNASGVSTTGSTATGSDAATNRSTATTGNTGSGDPNRNAASGNNSGAPMRLVLRMTKDQLQNAPSFQIGTDASDAPAAGSSTPNRTTAPQ